jgi:hypothetical protein
VITLEKLTKGKMGQDKTGRVGIVMDLRNGRAYLRPVGGGTEWSAPVGDVEPYSLLRLKTAQTNAAAKRYRR